MKPVQSHKVSLRKNAVVVQSSAAKTPVKKAINAAAPKLKLLTTNEGKTHGK